MLKKQTIKYFQAHKDSIIEYSPGVTYLVGDNDSGKSAILRSLRWIVENSPSGFGFRSHFANKKDVTFSTMEFNDTEVSRERSNSINQYIVGSEEYKALAGKVPEEIKEIIKLDDLNIQNQYEPYFLLNATPGKIAEKFNEVFGLEIIDTSYTNIKKIISKAKNSKTHTDEQAKKQQKDIKELAWIDDIDKDLCVLEGKEERNNSIREKIIGTEKILVAISNIEKQNEHIQEILMIEIPCNKLIQKNGYSAILKNKINAINKVLLSIEKTQNKLDAVERVIKFEKDVDSLIEKGMDLKKKNKRIRNIEKVIGDLVIVQKKIEQTEIINFEDVVLDLLEKSEMVKKINTRGKKIAGVVREILKAKNKINSVVGVIKCKEEEHKKILGDLKICPLCGNTL